jgi:hypothetical protein
MLLLDEPMKPSESFTGRVELLENIAGYDKIVFDAECRWCRKNVTQHRWESGFIIKLVGVNEYLFKMLQIDFELNNRGDNSISDVKTVEIPNRRMAVRFELNVPLLVMEKSTYRELGSVVDLSSSGVGIIMNQEIRESDTVECRVILPKKIFRQEFLLLTLVCVRCVKLRNNNLFMSGFKVASIEEENASVMAHLIKYYAQEQQTQQKFAVVK